MFNLHNCTQPMHVTLSLAFEFVHCSLGVQKSIAFFHSTTETQRNLINHWIEAQNRQKNHNVNKTARFCWQQLNLHFWRLAPKWKYIKENFTPTTLNAIKFSIKWLSKLKCTVDIVAQNRSEVKIKQTNESLLMLPLCCSKRFYRHLVKKSSSILNSPGYLLEATRALPLCVF